MANISIIGTGYVGLVSGACLADFGNMVICVDSDAEKINSLKKGIIPIYEPGLDTVVDRNVSSGRLSFTTDFTDAVKKNTVVFIAVGTPPADDGSADLQYVEAVARGIGKVMETYTVIVDKSTVPVGTARKVMQWVTEELKKRSLELPFDVVSNPEFLREGTAVYDFTHPDRVVIGAESEKARETMKDVYRSLYINETPFIETGLESAEMIKYASNAFLAVKITFINEIANLCEKTGADVKDISRGMGKDGRISPKFLHAGPGYGGSCFPKDTRALAKTGREYNEIQNIVEAAIETNEKQKIRAAKKIETALGTLKDKTIAILGLSFKPNTDDMREAPSITICEELVRCGALLRLFDPAARKEALWRLESIQDSIYFAEDEYDAVSGSHALVIITEWNQFRNMDLAKIKNNMKPNPAFFDLRNIYKRHETEEAGFSYFAVGR